MVSITLSVSEETRKQMKRFSDVNWSSLVRACIESKAKQLAWKQEMLAKLKEEDESGFTEESIRIGRKIKEGMWKRYKEKGW
jgi:negative regulator of sigma E activity